MKSCIFVRGSGDIKYPRQQQYCEGNFFFLHEKDDDVRESREENVFSLEIPIDDDVAVMLWNWTNRHKTPPTPKIVHNAVQY